MLRVTLDHYGLRLPYTDIFGGAGAVTREQMVRMNGFPNDYWGWGGEDDDMATRIRVNGYRISRYPANIAKYKMIKHTQEKTNPVNKCRFKLLYKTKKRWKHDGLGNLRYKLVNKTATKLYTHLLVDLMERESKAEFAKEHLC